MATAAASGLTLAALTVSAVALAAGALAAGAGTTSPGPAASALAGRAAAQVGSQLAVGSLAVPTPDPATNPSVGETIALSSLPLPLLSTLVAPSVALATSPVSPGVWAELRQCESGGNYATDTGNGYYGAYQFSEPTWLGIGETGYPYQASPAEQDAAAQRLQARSGWGQWPACSERLGL